MQSWAKALSLAMSSTSATKMAAPVGNRAAQTLQSRGLTRVRKLLTSVGLLYKNTSLLTPT